MKVNPGKTGMLCISSAMLFLPGTYIITQSGKVASSGWNDTMKLLGFHLSNRPAIHAHVEALRKRFCQRLWILIHLRNFGFTEQELVQVYITTVQPVEEYCVVVYHSQAYIRPI